ncbi:hypothetical protein SAMN05421788_105265 [Filimonas lacunae]|uniref:Uncharacterized protein n=1 Tax=Filimonas lacunae TaxID=477680 RepID=A0A1N7QHA6_9BACT|nr:hypothetical protein SAMN05421788_105265 [Filimonas lacunae]
MSAVGITGDVLFTFGIMSNNLRNTLVTVLFYVVIGLVIFLSEKLAPHNPHTPSLGVLLLLFLSFCSPLLFVAQVVRACKRGKPHVGPAIVHLLACICIYVCWSYYF